MIPDNNRMGYIARQGVSHLLAAKQRAAACTLALRLDVLGYLLQEYDRTAVLRNLTIVDDATTEAVAVVRALGGLPVTRVLDALAVTRGLP